MLGARFMLPAALRTPRQGDLESQNPWFLALRLPLLLCGLPS